MKKNSNTHWTPIQEYGAFYRIENNQLKTVPMLKDGSIDKEQLKDAIIVDSVEDEKFLEVVNDKLGSDFKINEFC